MTDTLNEKHERAFSLIIILVLLAYFAVFAIVNFAGFAYFCNADMYEDTLVARLMWEQKTLHLRQPVLRYRDAGVRSAVLRPHRQHEHRDGACDDADVAADSALTRLDDKAVYKEPLRTARGAAHARRRGICSAHPRNG